MRKRFEQQLTLGQIAIKDVEIPLKCRDSMVDLLAALKEIFLNFKYNEKIFSILEDRILLKKQSTGRKGMNLWLIFVLAQVRLCLNISYDRLLYLSNNDKLLRKIMGVEKEFGYETIEFNYQNIYDNVTLLDDETLRELNAIIVEFGHEVFKKRRRSLALKKR